MTVEFIEKDYGYKVVDMYGYKLGEIEHIGGIFSTLFKSARKCDGVTIDQMREITTFMKSLECQKEYL